MVSHEDVNHSYIRIFNILDFQNKNIGELSTGMRQKAAIAISLVHNPEWLQFGLVMGSIVLIGGIFLFLQIKDFYSDRLMFGM